MEGKVTLVMEHRGEASLQYSFLQQIEFPPHAVINPHWPLKGFMIYNTYCPSCHQILETDEDLSRESPSAGSEANKFYLH